MYYGKTPTVFVMFIDDVLESLKGDSLLCKRFLSFQDKFSCMIVSRFPWCWNAFKSQKTVTINYNKITIPSLNFQASLFQEGKCKRIDELAYVSDDFDFILEAEKSLAFSIFINLRKKKSLHKSVLGNAPDMTTTSFVETLTRIERSQIQYAGNELMYGSGLSTPSFITSTIEAEHGMTRYPIMIGGRYFGAKDFVHPFDSYSNAITANKRINSKLYHKFDPLVERILSAGITALGNAGINIDSICATPCRPNKDERNAEILEQVSLSTGLVNILPNFKCTRDYGDQKSTMSQFDRQSNVGGAFKYTGGLKGRNILLYDDIITTGATLVECASTLMKSGADNVICMVLAVNQFKREYWIPDTTKQHFENYHLRFNGKTLKPFSVDKTGNNTRYDCAMEELVQAITKDMISYKIPSHDIYDMPF